jgi:hypothetical protein
MTLCLILCHINLTIDNHKMPWDKNTYMIEGGCNGVPTTFQRGTLKRSVWFPYYSRLLHYFVSCGQNRWLQAHSPHLLSRMKVLQRDHGLIDSFNIVTWRTWNLHPHNISIICETATVSSFPLLTPLPDNKSTMATTKFNFGIIAHSVYGGV